MLFKTNSRKNLTKIANFRYDRHVSTVLITQTLTLNIWNHLIKAEFEKTLDECLP